MRINTLIKRLKKDPAPSIINDKEYYKVEELALIKEKGYHSYSPIVVLGFCEKKLNYYIMFSEKAKEIKGFKKPVVEKVNLKYRDTNSIEEYISY